MCFPFPAGSRRLSIHHPVLVLSSPIPLSLIPRTIATIAPPFYLALVARRRGGWQIPLCRMINKDENMMDRLFSLTLFNCYSTFSLVWCHARAPFVIIFPLSVFFFPFFKPLRYAWQFRELMFVTFSELGFFFMVVCSRELRWCLCARLREDSFFL